MQTLDRLAHRLNAPLSEVENRLEALLAEQKGLQKEVEQLRRQVLLGQFEVLMAQVRTVAGVPLLAAVVDGADADGLRFMTDHFRERLGSGVAVLAAVQNERPVIVAAVTDDLVKRGVKAGDLVREVAKMVGGGGGGRPHLAQAGGRDASKLPEALAAVPALVEQALS
jgi:alanyl-tRNA synthetase